MLRPSLLLPLAFMAVLSDIKAGIDNSTSRLAALIVAVITAGVYVLWIIFFVKRKHSGASAELMLTLSEQKLKSESLTPEHIVALQPDETRVYEANVEEETAAATEERAEFCSQCGAHVPENTRYCKECGTRLRA